MTVQEALAFGVSQLADAGIDSAARDARRLMAHALGVGPDRITLHLRDELEAGPEAVYFADLSERAERRPVSHLVGGRDFYGRWFSVNEDVLDPRPETETLIAAALELTFRDVLDLGTGTGCILLILLAENPTATGIGVDVSAAALRVAKRNADALGVADRCALVVSDWWQGVAGQFDLIVSNPPYIAAAEMAGLAPELGFEPRMALTDEKDGLSAYRIIAGGAGAHLAPDGMLMVEIGHSQGGAVAAMLQDAGFVDVQIRTDLDGRDRVVMGRKPAQMSI
ncbi:peptide chain release factor N(5)-glutamine methyltransferase [Roseovarius pelagicus]|uniref:Release factor glutamine methyltransferase n=1 Tax=Roseovarius pelagicus TaxID=2980108 RepID=A0ABY6DCR2_9RHOB|nr:peptide chain release factor N(5)-glutamine methyltransferase [Roseovarius pelagicus]UXX83937.1 peptide chain release factor N(5)-glutamine methyltransferase [Roseovarius pelagicus]